VLRESHKERACVNRGSWAFLIIRFQCSVFRELIIEGFESLTSCHVSRSYVAARDLLDASAESVKLS
jgi:hypothetical protein